MQDQKENKLAEINMISCEKDNLHYISAFISSSKHKNGEEFILKRFLMDTGRQVNLMKSSQLTEFNLSEKTSKNARI